MDYDQRQIDADDDYYDYGYADLDGEVAGTRGAELLQRNQPYVMHYLMVGFGA